MWKADSGTYLHQAKQAQQVAANSSSVPKAILVTRPKTCMERAKCQAHLGPRSRKGPVIPDPYSVPPPGIRV